MRPVAKLPCLIGLAVVIALLGVGCGSGRGGDGFEWVVWEVKGPRELRISGQTGYCVGRHPKPKIHKVEVEYEDDRIYITARMKPNPAVRESQTRPCAGVILGVLKTVHLKRDIADSVIYDTSTDPPTQRWPD